MSRTYQKTYKETIKKNTKNDLHRNLRAYNRRVINDIIHGVDPEGMPLEESKNRFSDIWDYD